MYSTGASGLSKPKADRLYVNTSSDKMTGDLNMGGFQISNVETPEDLTDVSVKAYDNQQLQSMKTILQAEMDQHDNNITYKFKIQTGHAKMIATLMVPIERIVIQSIWLKSGDKWINATHNDDVKYMATFESGHLYFYCKKLHTRFTGDCMLL